MCRFLVDLDVSRNEAVEAEMFPPTTRSGRVSVVSVPGGLHGEGLDRKFATDLKAVPLTDLARLGGWADVNTLIKCYLGPDMAALRDVLDRRRTYGAPRLRAADSME